MENNAGIRLHRYKRIVGSHYGSVVTCMDDRKTDGDSTAIVRTPHRTGPSLASDTEEAKDSQQLTA